MGFRFRKSIKILPGIQLNIGNKGISVTLGNRKLRHTISSGGRRTTTVKIPGTGLSYSRSTRKKHR